MTVAEPGLMAAQLTIPQTSIRREKAIRIHVEPESRPRLHTLFIVCKIALVLLVIATAIAGYFTYTAYQGFAELVDRQIAGGYLRGHAGLYASPRVIEKGARLSKDELVTSLQKAGYVSGATSNIWSGSYSQTGDSIRVSPRQQSEKYEWIDIRFDQQNHIASLAASDGTAIPSYSLEPQLLTDDARLKIGEQKTLTYKDLPPVLVNAIVAIEDRRFFQHSGLDLRGIARAFLNWVGDSHFKIHQGGSTITQQLVKNTYLTPEKTFRRKFNEAMIALNLEQRLSKQDIFALYCNEIYLGQRDGSGVRGVAQAAEAYFGKELKDLTLEEAATIAGMIQSPARYAPDRHPESSKQRRDQVLAAMETVGFIDHAAAQEAMASAIKVAPSQNNNQFAPYYVDAVNRAVENAQLTVDGDNEQNTRVETTIDPDLQSAAERSLRRQLELLHKRGKKPQGALVAMDVHNGHVLAMVGGANYAESQLNRATDAKRQPGSVFKPFVYATAIESGISPLALFRDEPQTFEYGAASYSPANYGHAYSMHQVLLRDALVRSLNTVTVDVAMRTGLTRISSTASRFGLTPPPVAYPSLALGTTEATPLQMAAAYAAFANGGIRTEPILIDGVVDGSGNRLLETTPTSSSVIKATTAYLITDMLQDVINRGTARRARGSLKGVAIAGKTGTSRDGWFVGYTPNLVCAVWVGYDDNKQLGLTGAEAALPAWIEFMKEAVAMRPSLGGAAFAKPAGIVTVKIDPESGFLAGPDCPVTQTVTVASQFAPAAECYVHSPEYQMAEYSDTELDDAGATIEPIDDNAQATEADFDQMSPEPKMIGTDELQDGSGNKLAAVDDEIVNMQSLQLAHPKPAPKSPGSKRVLDTLRRYPE
jgi:penicillin-binding protein 1B